MSSVAGLADCSSLFLADAGHVIIFHLLTEGRGYAHLEGADQPVPLSAGDIAIFPHGDPHVMGNGSAAKAVDIAQELERILSHGLKISRAGEAEKSPDSSAATWRANRN